MPARGKFASDRGKITTAPKLRYSCPECGAHSHRYGLEKNGAQRWRCKGVVKGGERHIWHSVIATQISEMMGADDYVNISGIIQRFCRSNYKILHVLGRSISLLLQIAERTAMGGDHWFRINRAESMMKVLNSDSKLARAAWGLISLTSPGLNYCRGPEVYMNLETFDLREYGERTWAAALEEFLNGRPVAPFLIISGPAMTTKVRDSLISCGYILAAFDVDGEDLVIALRNKLLGA